MAKKTAPIEEVSRLLDLVPYLSTHSHISLKELAKEFGISEKEMANELTALSMCGLPGYTPYELIEIFFDSGFVTINNHEALDIPRALTNLEVASLLIGLEILKDSISGAEPRVDSKIEELIAQMRALLGESIEIEGGQGSAYLSQINSAIASRRPLEIQYLSPVRDEISTRKIDPLSLHVDRGFTYLVAYCYLQHGIRHFRLDRISHISEASTENSGQKSSPSEHLDRLSIRLSVSGARRSVAEIFGVEEIPENGQIGAEIFSPDWATKAVIALAPDVSLVEPAELRQRTRDSLQNILALYTP